MIKRKIVALFGITFLLLGVNLHAQVTIGANIRPNDGALLDLRNSELSAISTKGLGMPRVILTDLDPTSPSGLASSIGATGTWDLDVHIGLFVYNTTEGTDASLNEKIYTGLHVWDGSRWQHLSDGSGGGGGGTGSITSGCTTAEDRIISTFTDSRDNEVYTYASFGPAGKWMTQNLRYIPIAEGYTHGMGPQGESPSSSGTVGLYYVFPEGGTNSYSNTGSYWTNPDTYKVNGLLYTWGAATSGQNTQYQSVRDQHQSTLAIGSQEVESLFEKNVGMNDGYIQGLCPDGWHLPSDREWNYLEEEINFCPTVYADGFEDPYQLRPEYIYPIERWLLSWSTDFTWDGTGQRGAHAYAIWSKTPPPTISSQNYYGRSKVNTDGGFDMKNIGIGYHYFGENRLTYGGAAYFWSSSSYYDGGINGYAAVSRFLNDYSGTKSTVGRIGNNSVNYLKSVRCVMNN